MSEVRTPPRRLADLNPRWVGHGGDGVRNADGSPVPRREGVGLMCRCPCLAGEEGDWETCPRGNRIYVPFANPLDGGGVDPSEPYGTEGWQRTGDTFETLTLSPSIHAVGHWHGWIRDGQVVSC